MTLIIDNSTSTENHFYHIKKMAKMADEVFITSPFLMKDFKFFFDAELLSSINSINLITTIQPNSFDQLKKVYSLISLIDIPEIKAGKIKCIISVNNKLHGKVYIFKKSSNYIGGIISSANFTYNGLELNHEWGISLTDENTLEKLESSILTSIEPDFRNISHKSIRKLSKHVKAFLAQQGNPPDEDIDLDLTEFLENELTETRKKNSNSSNGDNKTYEYKITNEYLESWDTNFEDFLKFKSDNNEVTVPNSHKPYSLYLWYRKQKIFNTNGTIPPKHKTKLEQVGFYFGDAHEIRWAKIWEENYELLKEYFDDYGDSDVPHTRDKDDAFYTLGNWVASQKTYRNNNVLSDYKIEKLNDLDFIWNKSVEFNPLNETWLNHFEELKRWDETNDNCHIPQVNEDGTQNKLGRWLNEQRRLKNTGRKKKNGEIAYLDSERELLLLELGFDFDHEANKHKDSFEKQIQSFLSYRYRYPDLNPPTGTFKEERDNLAQWRHKFDKLPDWKQKRLIELKIINNTA